MKEKLEKKLRTIKKIMGADTIFTIGMRGKNKVDIIRAEGFFFEPDEEMKEKAEYIG